MDTKRKTAVVMFSDVVGYTRMMGADEAATLSRVQQSHSLQKELIARYQGHFIKEIGDGLLAYFDRTEDAISCCTEIQVGHQAFDLQIRVGLNRADIILKENDIYGDGVNIASRIESLADPGGIYISEEVTNSVSSAKLNVVRMGLAKLKNVRIPVPVYALQGGSLPVPNKRRFQELARPHWKLSAVPTILISVAVMLIGALFTIKYFQRREQIQNARESLSDIAELIQMNWRDLSEPYESLLKAARWIPDDPELQKLVRKSSVVVSVNTEPPGAEVFIRKYNEPDALWQSIGITPIDSVRLPITFLRWKAEKKGFATVLAAETTFSIQNMTHLTMEKFFSPNNFFRKLDPVGTVPEGMTRVTGGEMAGGRLEDFFIDKFEVTNRDFKKFVDTGGYVRKEFWKEKFRDQAQSLTWEAAMKRFVDKSGLPGPSTWSGGSYPPGEDNRPVGGVSWYEAMAFAEFANKDIPTGDHWGLGRGENTFVIQVPQLGGDALFQPFSNFKGTVPEDVGHLGGLTPYGAFDMAGNVREWCINDAPAGKLIRGGSFGSNSYMFGILSQAPPLDRSAANGFRCVFYLGKPGPEAVFRQVSDDSPRLRPENNSPPVSDAVFEIYKKFYDYDHTSLNETVTSRDNSHPEWIHERVELDAAYGNERIIAHLILPRNAKPPYQTVVYGPGGASFGQTSSDRITEYYEFPLFLDYIVRSGRAVVYPVVQGTFERRNDRTSAFNFVSETQQYAEFCAQVIKDYRRTLDYLETRSDFDSDKIAFYAMSWGPAMGVFLGGVEKRIKTMVFVAGGMEWGARPEVDLVNFLPRVQMPTLMINGRFDSIYPLSQSIEPFFDGLGTRKKKLALFDTDHIPPRDKMIAETLKWMDEYLGKAR